MFLIVAAIQKGISKILKLTNISREKGQSDLWWKEVMWPEFTSLATKLNFFADEILQCLVDKYQVTYQNI